VEKTPHLRLHFLHYKLPISYKDAAALAASIPKSNLASMVVGSTHKRPSAPPPHLSSVSLNELLVQSMQHESLKLNFID